MQSQLHVWANAKLSTFNSLLVRFTPFVCCGVYHLMKRFADNSVARRTTHMRTRAVTMALSAKKKCTICVPQRNEVFCQTKHPPPPFSIPLSPSPLLYTGKWQWAARHQFESELESFCHCCLFCFHAFVRPFSTLFTRALSLTLPFLMSCNYI